MALSHSPPAVHASPRSTHPLESVGLTWPAVGADTGWLTARATSISCSIIDHVSIAGRPPICRTPELSRPAALPGARTDASRATRNLSAGRVGCSAGFGVPLLAGDRARTQAP